MSIATPAVGQLLDGRYRIGPLIARGGMARVFEALDTRLDRVVAIKVLDPELARDPDFEARFVREARAAARLSHPHVVPVYDQGRDGDLLYLVMERVVGPTLRQVLREDGALSTDRALAITAEVLSAVQAAHNAGLVHRDLKPENVLLGSNANGDQVVKVTDFGLARAITDTTSTTRGIVLGTVSYLAPEQVDHGRVDERTDVYAIGILLFELTTGRRPYSGDNPLQVAFQHVNSDVPAPSSVSTGIPGEVDALVRQATRRDPAARFASAREFGDQVRLVAARRADRRIAPDQHTREVVVDTLTDVTEPPATSLVPAAGRDVVGRDPALVATGRRRRRRLPAVLAVLVVLAGLVAGAYYLGVARYTTAPDLTGLTLAQAQAKAAGDGLVVVNTGEDFSETVPVGTVVVAEPDAGGRVRKGGTVDLTMSKGPERFDVPKLIGSTVAQARSDLEATSLALGNTTDAYSETVAKGRIISADPVAGTPLPRDRTVNVVVSQGRQPIDVPKVVGKSEADATKAITSARLKVDRQSAFSDTVPQGIVISQTPKAGTLYRNDSLRIVVSNGPELIQVPGVRGDSVSAATARLEGLGFEVDVSRSTFYFGRNLVIGQSPGGGNKARKGSTIHLTVV